jgi:phospholipid/cholesterol/gamma-HCH transport system substrate-binding protein
MSHRASFAGQRVRVAALIVVGILLLIYAIYQVGQIFDVFADRYTIFTRVPDVAGLREGAPVTLAGQRVGQVSSIEFIPVERKRDHNNLDISLNISEEVRNQIRRDSRVFLRAAGLLGDKYVDITPGSARTAVLQERDTIQAEPSMDIEMFLARGGAVLDTASKMVADLRRIAGGLSRGEGTMGQLLTNDALYARMVATTVELQGTLQQFNRPDGTFGRMLRDPTMYNRMLSAVARVDSIGGMIMGGRGSLGKLIGTDSLYRGLFSTVKRADTAAIDFAGFLHRMTNGTGSIQKMATDPRLYDELLKAIMDLQTIVTEMRANPQKYLPPINVKVF